jgi:hypothetical protein
MKLKERKMNKCFNKIKSDGTAIGSIWKRVFSLAIDITVLSVFGFILGVIFEEFFIEVAWKGRIIGFIIEITYFGVLNSVINHGQTIWKKITGLKVVDINHNEITVKKSLTRSVIYILPFTLNGSNMPFPESRLVLTVLLFIVITTLLTEFLFVL